jgi:hypothetical protein
VNDHFIRGSGDVSSDEDLEICTPADDVAVTG